MYSTKRKVRSGIFTNSKVYAIKTSSCKMPFKNACLQNVLWCPNLKLIGDISEISWVYAYTQQLT